MGRYPDVERGSFPPKNVKVDLESSTTLSPSLTVFPSTALAQSQIWDEKIRVALRTPKYKKKDIDQRRSNVRLSNLVGLTIF